MSLSVFSYQSFMGRMAAVAVLGLGISAMGGCVSMDQYKASQMDRARLTEQLADAQRNLDRARAEADLNKKNYDDLVGRGDTASAITGNLQNELAQLRATNEQLRSQYDDAVRRIGEAGSGPLPTPLSNELTAFANQNSDLVDFDAARGIVKFKSDVTFAPGDAQLTDRVRSVISRFSQILNSPAAANYELLVCGHTDNQPVSNPNTIRNGHKDNWYLSAHRAISVGDGLIRDGVSARRLGVVGYADQRPVASNGTEAGKAQNRRVEVLILPTQVQGGAMTAGHSEGPAKTHVRENKDMPVRRAPAEFNK